MRRAAVMIFAALSLVAACTPALPDYPRSRNPQRIISLAPSITETLFAIGAGDRVVGVTRFCNWPPEAEKKPVVAEFARVDFEKILWQMPDLVIASEDTPSETVGYNLAQYKIPTLVARAATLDEVSGMVRQIGNAVGEHTSADEIARSMELRTREIERRVEGTRPVKVILVFGHDPLILAGPGTFADDLIRRAGGINVASDAPIKYPKYSVERIVLAGPEVIIEASHSPAYDSPDMIAIRDFWNQWPDIPAVRSGRVTVVDADLVTRPGPRIVDGFEVIARAIHPERMP